MNGTGHLEILSHPQGIENSRQFLLLRTDILQKAVVGCPCPLHEKIRLVFTCRGTLIASDGDHGEKGHAPKYKAPPRS